MEKEEQYMKLIELRRVATQAKTELKLMKTKVARLERQAKKKDDQVETTLGKAAAAITAALRETTTRMAIIFTTHLL